MTKTKIFSSLNQAVILSFKIESQTDFTAVLTAEWIFNDEPYWITSNQYEVYKQKESFCALTITSETPRGNWTVNIYLGDALYSSSAFTLE